MEVRTMFKNARLVGAIAAGMTLYWTVLNSLPSQERGTGKSVYVFQPEAKKRVLIALQWMTDLEKTKFPIYNLNRGGLHVDTVYHYLSGGWLIVGEIAGEAFFPGIEKNNTIKVISLDDYLRKYDPEQHIRIYNLPVRIVKKGEGEKKR